MIEGINGRERPNTRLILVREMLLRAQNRARLLGKLMIDPMDLLIQLVYDPSVRQAISNTGIDMEKLLKEISVIDKETPQGEEAAVMIRAFNISPGNYRSMVLDQSIAEAIRVADSERVFDVTPLHLLAGILRQGNSIGVSAFRNIRITDEQLNVLARIH